MSKSLSVAARLPDPAVLDRDDLRAVLSALGAEGAVSRVVGGAVRDAMLDLPVRDVDVATEASPQEVMRLLDAHGVPHAEPGLEHGSVMALFTGAAVEITTLRRDVETFGRRARVALASPGDPHAWSADAARRDFTINALYADADGSVHDFVGGLEDLQARRVRFIGDPRERIREDALRMLRFFRFHARFSPDAPLDAAALDACAQAAAERGFALNVVSKQRVLHELFLMLDVESPSASFEAMAHSGVLAAFLPGVNPTQAARRLRRLETSPHASRLSLQSEARFAVIIGDAETAAAAAAALPLSKKRRTRLFQAFLPVEESPPADDSSNSPRASSLNDLFNSPRASSLNDPNTPIISFFATPTPSIQPSIKSRARRSDDPFKRPRALLARLGADAYNDALALRLSSDAPVSRDFLEEYLLNALDALKEPVPVFPLRGRDVLSVGVAQGARVGDVLSELHKQWLNEDAKPSRKDLLTRLRSIARLFAPASLITHYSCSVIRSRLAHNTLLLLGYSLLPLS